MEFTECLTGRRSVRAYTTQDVSDEDVRKVVDLARWAPSWANTQCVNYLAVRDQGIKDRLVEIMSPTNPGKAAVKGAPVVVVFVAKLKIAGWKKGAPVDDRQWHMFDAGCAVQSFCLAAHSLGLGTVIVGFFDYRKAAEILAIPEGYEVVGFTPVGRPEKPTSAPKRLEARDLLHFGTMRKT
ncbi:MAG: nitroreductase family protein [Planctomycetes bacterium]|jgi:nitroreductase|nr:nitroreductase family protein [Planctomycetota bacterium]